MLIKGCFSRPEALLRDIRFTIPCSIFTIILSMFYNEKLADRVRVALVAHGVKKAEEKFMFGGVCFMVNGKMCMGIAKDELMCRIDPAVYESALEKRGCRHMDFTGKPMKGYVFVSGDGLRGKKEMDHWVALCLDFNKRAKASKKKTPAAKKKAAVKKKR